MFSFSERLTDQQLAIDIRRRLDLGLPMDYNFRTDERVALLYVNGDITYREYMRYLTKIGVAPSNIGDFLIDAWKSARKFFAELDLAEFTMQYIWFGKEPPKILMTEGHPVEILREYKRQRKEEKI